MTPGERAELLRQQYRLTFETREAVQLEIEAALRAERDAIYTELRLMESERRAAADLADWAEARRIRSEADLLATVAARILARDRA